MPLIDACLKCTVFRAAALHFIRNSSYGVDIFADTLHDCHAASSQFRECLFLLHLKLSHLNLAIDDALPSIILSRLSGDI